MSVVIYGYYFPANQDIAYNGGNNIGFGILLTLITVSVLAHVICVSLSLLRGLGTV